jgi:prepilin peptidase CpaA
MSAAIIALVVSLIACVTDLRSRRIPNVLTLGGAAAALLFHAVTAGGAGIGVAASGWLVGTAVFFPFFLLRGMGAGDVKLMAAIGAWLGPAEALEVAIYASLVGGVLALGVALAKGYLRAAFRNLGGLLKFWWHVGPRPMEGLTLDQSKSPRVAFAIPICCGVVMALWIR